MEIMTFISSVGRLVESSKFAKGGPNPLANMDSRGSISASGFRPGGPYPLADLDRGVQIQGGPNPLGQGNLNREIMEYIIQRLSSKIWVIFLFPFYRGSRWNMP